MSALYSSLPPKSYSIHDFVRCAKTLEDDDNSTFLPFILTGEGPDSHQVILDPTRNLVEPAHPLVASRDYDSVIAITKEIVVDTMISVYPVPNPAQRLTTSIHIKYPITNGETVTYVPMHRIPNFEFAYWGQRHMIHIFFPSLLSEERTSPSLSVEEKTTFYEQGLRPAIATLRPADVSDWPSTYDTEMFRAKKKTGHVSYQTKVLNSYLFPALVATIRANLMLANADWADDFFFIHTIRGTKHGTQHSMNRDAAQTALSEFLYDASIPLAAMDHGEWWFDVGVEISSSRQECLQWRTTSHFHIVKEVLQIQEGHASRVTSLGSSKYSRDLASHLTAVSGCRIEPGVQAAGPYEAAYFQMYTTDKALTFNPENHHHGKAISMREALGQTQPPKFVEGLFNLYISAVESNSSNARVEVRVPHTHATSVLTRLDINIVRESLVSFTRSDWWNFRAYRMLAISCTLSLQASGSPPLRVKPDALLLSAACVWLTNGPHARPDDGPASRSLMQAILPVTDADDADRDTLAYNASSRTQDEEEESDDESSAQVPYNPFGVVFLRRLMVHVDVPRFRAGGPFLTVPAFKYLFGASQEEIRMQYSKVGVVSRELIAEKRIVTNKSKRTPTYSSPPGVTEEVLFNLGAEGHTLPPPAVDSGSDMESDEDRGGSSGDIDVEVSQLWRQFLADLAAKSPSMRGATNPSYLSLTRAERLSAGEALYMNNKLSDVWRACRYKVASKKDWKLAFNHLFPLADTKTPASIQGYNQCEYFRKWKEISVTANASSFRAIRAEMWKRIWALYWIPHACQDKLWGTNQTPKGFTRLPPNSTGPAPRILVKRVPVWESDEPVVSV